MTIARDSFPVGGSVTVLPSLTVEEPASITLQSTRMEIVVQDDDGTSSSLSSAGEACFALFPPQRSLDEYCVVALERGNIQCVSAGLYKSSPDGTDKACGDVRFSSGRFSVGVRSDVDQARSLSATPLPSASAHLLPTVVEVPIPVPFPVPVPVPQPIPVPVPNPAPQPIPVPVPNSVTVPFLDSSPATALIGWMAITGFVMAV